MGRDYESLTHVFVTSSDHGEHALVIGRIDGVGPGGLGGATEAHADHARSRAAFADDVVDGPVETGQDHRGRTLAFRHLEGASQGEYVKALAIGRLTDSPSKTLTDITLAALATP